MGHLSSTVQITAQRRYDMVTCVECNYCGQVQLFSFVEAFYLQICNILTLCYFVASPFSTLFAQVPNFYRKFISTSPFSRSSKKGRLRSCTPEKVAVKTETVCKRQNRSNGTNKTAFVLRLPGVALLLEVSMDLFSPAVKLLVFANVKTRSSRKFQLIR